MQADLSGKVALVTGASQGIGLAISQVLARSGAFVALTDIQDDKGIAAAESLGRNASYHHCDVSDSGQVREVFDAVASQHGHLDIAVNNAGINTCSPEDRVTIDEYREEIWHRILNVDLNGAFYCSKAASRLMTRQGSGVIINIASIAGVVPLRLQVGFVAAKAAVIRMTEAMACELGPRGIRVNCVSPGSTLVQGTRELFYSNHAMAQRLVSFIPQGRPGETHEIAEAVLFLASETAAYINGHNLIVDGGWTCGFTRDF